MADTVRAQRLRGPPWAIRLGVQWSEQEARRGSQINVRQHLGRPTRCTVMGSPNSRPPVGQGRETATRLLVPGNHFVHSRSPTGRYLRSLNPRAEVASPRIVPEILDSLPNRAAGPLRRRPQVSAARVRNRPFHATGSLQWVGRPPPRRVGWAPPPAGDPTGSPPSGYNQSATGMRREQDLPGLALRHDVSKADQEVRNLRLRVNTDRPALGGRVVDGERERGPSCSVFRNGPTSQG